MMTGRRDSYAALRLSRRHCRPLLAAIVVVVVACNKGYSGRKGIAGVKVAKGVEN